MQLNYPYKVHHRFIGGNVDIAYCDEGKGDETILFIHGLANYLPVWKHQVEGLKQHYRCIAVDLPGSGLSSRGDYPYTMFFYAECIKRFADALGLDKVILAGHSMGGQIAVILGLRYPELFSKLILVAPAGIEYFHPFERAFMQQMLGIGEFIYSDEAHLERSIDESFYTRTKEKRDLVADLLLIMKSRPLSQWRAMAKASINGMLNEQIQQFLPELKQETLLIFGDKDKMIPNRLIHFGETTAQVLNQGAALMPHCKPVLVKDAGHFVQIEKHAEVNDAVSGFLKESSGNKHSVSS